MRRYSIFDSDCNYFDSFKNGEICRKVAQRCYLPANRMLLQLIERYEGRFKVAFSLTGLVLEQFERYAPDALESFQKLADTGCVEFLGETYHHSLSFLYSREEFAEQVELHGEKVERLFGCRPAVFRNTELIYNNDLAHFITDLGYKAVLSEGADGPLAYRSPNHVYRCQTAPGLVVLLKNYRLSDDIAFRFGNRAWPEWPLTAEKYARWIGLVNGSGDLLNLFMNYEVLGEHQKADTGIFEFFSHLPDALLAQPETRFVTPTEAAESLPPGGDYDVPHAISWGDSERDLSAWLGNAMQSNALHELYRLEREVKATGDPHILHDWRCLQSSDHVYYMCTKQSSDLDVHKYFNPYDSPYDSYINFMNVLDNLRQRVGAQLRERRARLHMPEPIAPRPVIPVGRREMPTGKPLRHET